MSVSFLPKEFTFEDAEDKVIDCQIVQADPLGPAFVVKVRQMQVAEYRKVFEKLNKGNQTGGFRSNKTLNDKVDRDYLKRAIVDWSGLTPDNFNAICRSGKKLVGPKDGEIQYSEDVAFYLYRNTFPSDFGDPIWETLKNGAEEDEEADKE
jgi:hypothetical protein